jgi:hypothetical protein
MRENERDKTFIRSIVRELDEETNRLPPEVVGRLRDGRMRAIGVPPGGWFRYRIVPRWITAGGFATAAVLVAAVSIWYGGDRSSTQIKNLDELEIASSQEQLELYEDLDFYRWLADQPGSAGQRGVKR